MNEHEFYMRRTIELAANVPDLPFGALIVDRGSGKILSEGRNKSSINPTFQGRLTPSTNWSCPIPESTAVNLYFIRLPSHVRCARERSSGPVSKWSSLARPFALFKKWDGDRLTFLRKKWFVAVRHGNARSLAAYWNKSVTHFLQWRFHKGMIQNEVCIPGWCFSPVDGYNGDG